MSIAAVRPTGTHPALYQNITPDQIELLKNTICKGASDDELKLFLAICNRTRLDPFSKQIYAIKRYANGQNTMVTQVGIDGFRAIAERTGEYRGQTPYEWCGEDGVWKEVWLSDQPPAAARVGIMRRGFDQPLYAVATYRSYVQTTSGGVPNNMWKSMPDNQLAKCAESLGLRRAFPNELSGLYTEDEMGQADSEQQESTITYKVKAVIDRPTTPTVTDVTDESKPTNKPKPSKTAHEGLVALAKQTRANAEAASVGTTWSAKWTATFIERAFGRKVTSMDQLTDAELNDLINCANGTVMYDWETGDIERPTTAERDDEADYTEDPQYA